MSIGEQNTRARKSVEIRGLGLRVTTQAPDPVVQIIHANEQNIGPGLRSRWILPQQHGSESSNQADDEPGHDVSLRSH